MELLRGRTVGRELADRGRLPMRESVDLARQTLSALTAAHRLGVVHRDLKPENLFLHEAVAGSRQLKVLDFGLARIIPQASSLAPAPTSIPTGTGQVVGTPRFLSPEAIIGKPVDHRADLYAVGLVLFNALAGRGPFDHLTMEETLSHHPEPPSKFREERGTRELDAIVLHSLRKRPEDRFQSANDFASALESIYAQIP
jgi:serine/threonine-protein kinase